MSYEIKFCNIALRYMQKYLQCKIITEPQHKAEAPVYFQEYCTVSFYSSFCFIYFILFCLCVSLFSVTACHFAAVAQRFPQYWALKDISISSILGVHTSAFL